MSRKAFEQGRLFGYGRRPKSGGFLLTYRQTFGALRGNALGKGNCDELYGGHPVV